MTVVYNPIGLKDNNLEIAKATDITVNANSSLEVIPEQDMRNFSRFYYLVWSSVSHDYSILIRRRDEGVSAAFIDNEEIFSSNGSFAGRTPVISTGAAKLTTRIENKSAVNQTYKIVLMGVK